MMTKWNIPPSSPTSQDKYRLYYETYSGKAGDALAGGGGMVEQWSASLSGMQFSTRDQVPSMSSYQQHVQITALEEVKNNEADFAHGQDNDRYIQGSCAQENKAGWWFNR